MNHMIETPPENQDRMPSRTTVVMATTAIERWLAEMPADDRAKTYTPRQIEAAIAMPMAQLAGPLHACGFTHFTRRTPRGTPATYWAGPAAGDPKRAPGRPPHEDSTQAAFEATLFRGMPARVRPVWRGVDYDHHSVPSQVAGMAWDYYAHTFPNWGDNPGGRIYCLHDPELAAAILGRHGGNDRRTRWKNMAVTYGLMMGKRYKPGMESLARTLPQSSQQAFRAEWKQCEGSLLRQLDQAHKLNADGARPYELENWRQDFLAHWGWIADQMDRSTDPGIMLAARHVRAHTNHPDAGPRHEANPATGARR